MPFVALADVVAVVDNYPGGDVGVQPFNLDIVDKTVVSTLSGEPRISPFVNLNTVQPMPRKNVSFRTSCACRFRDRCDGPSASIANRNVGLAQSIL